MFTNCPMLFEHVLIPLRKMNDQASYNETFLLSYLLNKLFKINHVTERSHDIYNIDT